MKRVFLVSASLLPASAMFCGAVQADLGSAEDGVGDKALSGTIYDAWCGNKSNEDCKVKFENDRLIVNNGNGITASQIEDITMNSRLFVDNRDPNNKGGDHGARCIDHRGIESFYRPSCQVHFWIEYNDAYGETRNALVRFRNQARAYQFQEDIEAWSGIKFRERGPSVQIVN